MNDIAPIESWRPSAAINPERLDYLWKLSERIAQSSIVPESLRGERKGAVFNDFDEMVVLSNVFAVVEQADRWNISPFALMASSSIVRGKLMFEGKVIAAVLESLFGIKLHAYFSGEPNTVGYHVYLSDVELPDEVIDQLEPGYRHPRFQIMDGSVDEWKTDGNNSPWRPATYGKMLVYRGTREWSRVYKPSAIMGVLGDDEVTEMLLEQHARQAVPIAERFAPPPTSGFSADNIKQLENNSAVPMERMDATTGEFVEVGSGAQSDATPKTTSPGSTASAQPTDKKLAADAAQSVGGAGSTASGGSRPQEDPSPKGGNGSGDDGGDASTPVVRVSAEIWRGYHSALARVNSAESVQKAHDQFWGAGAGKGTKVRHPDDKKLGADIKENHLHRANGKVPAGEVAKAVESWIQAHTGGQL